MAERVICVSFKRCARLKQRFKYTERDYTLKRSLRCPKRVYTLFFIIKDVFDHLTIFRSSRTEKINLFFWQAEQIVATFFNPNTVQELFQLLITHYFKLSTADIQEWQNNPEEFLIEEKMDAWTEKRRVSNANKYCTFISVLIVI